ncbi:MAG: phosphoadenylyl-sulfate reductase [Rhodospirillaceae bacterium]
MKVVTLDTATLADRYATLSAEDMLDDLVHTVFPGQITLVSSFGTESAVLLHMLSRIDPDVPVLFLDTGKLFGETLRYRDTLVARLGLREVRTLHPARAALAAEDGDGLLFQRDTDRCCALRKVAPLRQALGGFAAWINGRKGHHGDGRANMPKIEADGPRLKATPLANWTGADVEAYFERHDLPRHPLQDDGYLSLGCFTCTERATDPNDPRSGRWAGKSKTECGIHTTAEVPYQDAWWPAG